MHPSDGESRVFLYDATLRAWRHFYQARRVLRAYRVDQVLPLLQEVERSVETEKCFAAGFLAYEAAPAFDPALHTHAPTGFPLAWFGLYAKSNLVERPAPEVDAGTQPGAWSPSVDASAYRAAIRQIKAFIAAGDTYQVNYSFRLRAPFDGDAWTYFLQLVQAQEAPYAAFVDTGRFAICSASPELFFQLDGEQLTSRPMKGTAKRGLSWEDDVQQGAWLQQSEKNRAENVMIVDMVRNDMGRIARTGSVSVPQLFTAERYPTLWQMTSTVTSQTTAAFPAIMQALFPCASITGAPKARTMQIITGLEPTPRHIYTGTIGYLAPDRRAQFNVAIRTVLVDHQQRQAEYGVGSGIVWDSTDEAEWDECLTKARVLTSRQPSFQLLETLLWTAAEGYFLLEYHLDRLGNSAQYFGFPVDLEAVRAALAERAATLTEPAHRLRLLLARSGALALEIYPHRESEAAAALHDAGLLWHGAVPIRRICLAPLPVDSRDPFLYHKTTQRSVYEQALAACPGFDDVLLWNERGEVTESCLANLVVERDGQYVTPAQSSGLLAGTYRRWLLERGLIREAVIRVEELGRCRHLWLVNAVRGWQPAYLLETQTQETGPLMPA